MQLHGALGTEIYSSQVEGLSLGDILRDVDDYPGAKCSVRYPHACTGQGDALRRGERCGNSGGRRINVGQRDGNGTGGRIYEGPIRKSR